MVRQDGQMNHFGIGHNDGRRRLSDFSALVGGCVPIVDGGRRRCGFHSRCQCLKPAQLIPGQRLQRKDIQSLGRRIRQNPFK